MSRIRLISALLLLSLFGAGCAEEEVAREGYVGGLEFLASVTPRDDKFRESDSLVAAAFLARPAGVREEDREFVEYLLEKIVSRQRDDGGIYNQAVANYSTCAAIFALANADGERYREAAEKAANFVMSLQTESGGIGYSDKHPGDPDLSNTQFAIEALRLAGVPIEHQVYRNAVEYLETVQNRSESNPGGYELTDGQIVEIQDDGGAFYKPTESKAGMIELPDGRVALRSYGSMTYALLKCYLMAGLPKDDPRIQDAVKWIRNHFTLDRNPGFVNTPEHPNADFQGYYYYLMTMAKALDQLEVETVKDSDGVEHDWRKELREELLSRQQKDGSWVNEAEERWMEGDPVLATSYALIALSYTEP